MKPFKIFKDRFQNDKDFVNVLANIAWSFFDKGLQMTLGLFVISWMARYLGPDQFGIWNYALAFVAIGSALAALGLDTIIIRDIVKYPEKGNYVLGSGFLMKFSASVITALGAVFLVNYFHADTEITKILVSIMSIGFLFQALDVIDFYFKSQMQNQYTVFARGTAFLLASIGRILLIVTEQPLQSFAYLFLGELILTAMFYLAIYQWKKLNVSGWRFDPAITRDLLQSGWPLFLAYICSILYLKIDQIMIGQMVDTSSLGVYSASLKIYDILFSGLIILSSTIFPKLVDTYKVDIKLFFRRFGQITQLYTWGAIALLLLLIAAGKFIIHILFGDSYAGAYPVLIIHAIGLIFVYNGALRSSYLSVTHNEKILLVTSAGSCLLNVILNFVLIQSYGIVGAAMATAITHFMALFASNYFFASTKNIFFIQLRAFFNFKQNFG